MSVLEMVFKRREDNIRKDTHNLTHIPRFLLADISFSRLISCGWEADIRQSSVTQIVSKQAIN